MITTKPADSEYDALLYACKPIVLPGLRRAGIEPAGE
jgi:hypothetical protein